MRPVQRGQASLPESAADLRAAQVLLPRGAGRHPASAALQADTRGREQLPDVLSPAGQARRVAQLLKTRG